MVIGIHRNNEIKNGIKIEDIRQKRDKNKRRSSL